MIGNEEMTYPLHYHVRREVYRYSNNDPLYAMKRDAEREALVHAWMDLIGPMMLEGDFSHAKTVRVTKEWIIDLEKTYSEPGHPTVWSLTLSVHIKE